MTTVQTIWVAVAIAILYPVAMRALAEIIQPMRLRMADLGNELIHSGSLNEQQLKIVRSMLDDAFEWRFMIFAAFCAPIIVVRRVLGFRLDTPFDAIKRADIDESVQRLHWMHLASVSAANPLFAMIVAAEFGLVIVLLLLARLMGRVMSIGDTARRISVIVEEEHGRQRNHGMAHSAS